jgi:hypothetical protein
MKTRNHIFSKSLFGVFILFCLTLRGNAGVIADFQSNGDCPGSIIQAGDKYYVCNWDSNNIGVFRLNNDEIQWLSAISITGVYEAIFSPANNKIYLICENPEAELSFIKVIDNSTLQIIEGITYSSSQYLVGLCLKKDICESILYSVWEDPIDGFCQIQCLDPTTLAPMYDPVIVSCTPAGCVASDDYLVITDKRLSNVSENELIEIIMSKVFIFNISGGGLNSEPDAVIDVGTGPGRCIFNADNSEVFIMHYADDESPTGITEIRLPGEKIGEFVIPGYSPSQPIIAGESWIVSTTCPMIPVGFIVGDEIMYFNTYTKQSYIVEEYNSPFIDITKTQEYPKYLACSFKTDEIVLIEPPDWLDFESPTCVLEAPEDGSILDSTSVLCAEGSHDSQSTNLRVIWDMGDGTIEDYTRENDNITHVFLHEYPGDGNYLITMTVLDDSGNKCGAYANITIIQPPHS